MVNYGIVGTGYFGAELGRALHRLEGANVLGVYDPVNAARPAAEFGAEVFDSMEALVRDPRVDAVIVASPNSMHVEPTLAAARAGKAIFAEKPIALSYADCAAMVDAAREAGVFFMAGHVMNFMNGVRLAKRLIASGELGRVLHIRSTRTGWESVQPVATWKKVRELSGGHLYHHVHELDCVQSILGPARFATMIGGNVAHSEDDVDDMLLIQLQFDGAFATLEYGSAFRWPEHYLLIQAEKGAIKIDLQDVGVTVRVDDDERRYLLHRTAEEDRQRAEIYAGLTGTDGGVQFGHPDMELPLWLSGIVEEEMTYFHGLMQGEPVAEEFAKLSDGTAAMESIATADACTLSLKENRTVAISEITG
ncbi:Gfo/Idh/MocA family protein [Trueperella bernardiae]|uniref:Gfo/Idh/MocA family protein n=1 Tax=Trueperella bernardiae TaxID=59561 RepID=UPI00204473CD|nr:Gfo/Idh/MocA family oxidoreductase [Trueperella bernardiae]MCM3908053.1 Gfo/Idh/MocA family oxidoreductase [Trueperella bernardiae]MDV6239578.1 Gfo/Idh/MocA family oxidoreductase [Trueperella bernardiae]WIM07974.1 Gfo/Idh/MocA family oxidoreductase [Trueperella bernardiae]